MKTMSINYISSLFRMLLLMKTSNYVAKFPYSDKCNFFFFKVFGGHMTIFGTTGTPVLDFW